MFIVNTSTKKFTESASLDLGLLPADGKIDIQLTDGTAPVVAEGKTFTMTVGTIEPTLYKTDDDTVSFRYIHFDDDNVATTMAITMTMDGVEVLDDSLSLTYTETGGGSVTIDDALSSTSPNPVQNAVVTTALNGKVNVEVPVPYESQVINTQKITCSGATFSTIYNTQSNVTQSYKLYGSSPESNYVSLVPGDSFTAPDVTISITLAEAVTITDADNLTLDLNYSDAVSNSEKKKIVQLYHNNEIIREGLFLYNYRNGTITSDANNIIILFDKILKKGTYNYAVGDTLKIVIKQDYLCKWNTTFYKTSFQIYAGSSYIYKNLNFLDWHNIRNLADGVNSYAPHPTYSMSYTTAYWDGSNVQVSPSNNYFNFNDPNTYEIGDQAYFGLYDDNFGIMFKTSSSFDTYTLDFGSNYPTYINKPISLEASKTYLFVRYYTMFFWTEIEEYDSSSSSN